MPHHRLGVSPYPSQMAGEKNGSAPYSSIRWHAAGGGRRRDASLITFSHNRMHLLFAQEPSHNREMMRIYRSPSHTQFAQYKIPDPDIVCALTNTPHSVPSKLNMISLTFTHGKGNSRRRSRIPVDHYLFPRQIEFWHTHSHTADQSLLYSLSHPCLQTDGRQQQQTH